MAGNVNRQRLLVLMLLDLRRHFASCRKCAGARKGRDFSMLCEYTQKELVEIAVKWDNNIAVRLHARRSDKEHIFPCPDPNKHGEAWAAAVEPVTVTARQGKLF
jgi:hypothetical protein